VIRSDRELVLESQRGDREAFRELVERYQRKIVAVAVGMVQNQDDALEIAQEAFIKAYQSLDKFKGESSFYTWLYRIVVNRAIDFRRRERRAPTVPLERPAGGGGDTAPYEELVKEERLTDPDRQAQAHEIRDRVSEAINELTPDHRAVILLREVEGLSYEEISRVMRCSKGTVMSRLHYARKKLQKRLKDCL
jgi:RNA polymerase sigma-70 factor (ECF subfamily)